MQNSPMSVTGLSNYIKMLLDGDAVLSKVMVSGELSNYKIHSSGHHYFTLKDDGAVISAVMFRGESSRLRFRPESGMKVIVGGRISSFPKSGQYQIYANSMTPDGVGELYVAFEQLKEKLSKEGLFAPEHKKKLPLFPSKVAIITSPTGAAVSDMIRILGSRYPACEVLVCPVKVQGDGSAQEVSAMIDYVNKYELADVIITGRGGGSIEDLWAFNEEIVARAIFASKIPVISAVGHEPDITISDYVADKRASTPSNAAELAVRDVAQVLGYLETSLDRMTRAAGGSIEQRKIALETLSDKAVLKSPYGYIDNQRMLLDLFKQRLDSSASLKLMSMKERFVTLSASLDAMSPLKVLTRGYAAVSKEGSVTNSVKTLKKGDNIDVRFADGVANCTVQTAKATKTVKTSGKKPDSEEN